MTNEKPTEQKYSVTCHSCGAMAEFVVPMTHFDGCCANSFVAEGQLREPPPPVLNPRCKKCGVNGNAVNILCVTRPDNSRANEGGILLQRHREVIACECNRCGWKWEGEPLEQEASDE